MIIICEPQAKGFSHEKINSGFIYKLRLAFPDEKLVFYAHSSHILAIKEIFIHDNIDVQNIEYVPIKFISSFSKAGMKVYSSLFIKIFSETIKYGSDKIFFLSFSPPILYVIKMLKKKSDFSNMKFAFVTHRDFENIVDNVDQDSIHPPPPPPQIKSLLEKVKHTKIRELPFKVFSKINNYIHRKSFKRDIAFAQRYPTKAMILLENSADYRYIVVSPHILPNAEKYLNLKEINIKMVLFPTIFSPVYPQPKNKFVKMAIFGYGNSGMLYKVLSRLSQEDIKKAYEIRIIGIDDRGTHGFKNISFPSSGKSLTRSEMEKYASDIDLFLILYENKSYRVSCSGSIIESLSYMKPILHFRNDCINSFNTPESPIGICVDTVDEFSLTMKNIIENYSTYNHKFSNFRGNILKLRQKFAIENSITSLRESFTWE
jgi:hypothetical protein